MRWKINHILVLSLVIVFGWACGVSAVENLVKTGEVVAKIGKELGDELTVKRFLRVKVGEGAGA